MAGNKPEYDVCISQKYEKSCKPRRTANRVKDTVIIRLSCLNEKTKIS
jgi:hypothetical protein